MTTEIRHHRYVHDGVVHSYVTTGSGVPLVLLHGFPQDWSEWIATIETLAGRFFVIAPNLRGLGGYPTPISGYDTHTIADDVRAIVESECGDAAAVVCGHDMGSFVALSYALRNPRGVKSLILVDAPLPGTALGDTLFTQPRTWHVNFHANVDIAHLLISGREREYVRYFIRSRLFDQGAVDDLQIQRYADRYSAPGALRAALEMYRALPQSAALNRAAVQERGRLRLPVCYVASSATARLPEAAEMLAEVAADGRVELLDGTGHFIPEEQPQRLAEIILERARS